MMAYVAYTPWRLVMAGLVWLALMVGAAPAQSEELDLATDGSEFFLQGGAPYDPKTYSETIRPFEWPISYQEKPEYGEEPNTWIKAIMVGSQADDKKLMRYDTALYNFSSSSDEIKKMLSQEIQQVVCRGAIWLQFRYIIGFVYPVYVHPFMTTARFRCGKTDVTITTSCPSVSVFDEGPCPATRIHLKNGNLEREYFYFFRAEASDCRCFVDNGHSWIIVYPTDYYNYHKEMLEMTARVDYFRDAEYLGSKFNDVDYVDLLDERKHVPFFKKISKQNYAKFKGTRKYIRTRYSYRQIKDSGRLYSTADICPLPAPARPIPTISR